MGGEIGGQGKRGGREGGEPAGRSVVRTKGSLVQKKGG